MSAYVFVVLTNATDGKEDEYNAWYDTQHIPDVLGIPGIVAAQRLRLSDKQRSDVLSPYKYCALYEMETDDLAGVIHELKTRAGTDRMPLTDALDPKRLAYIFDPIGEKVFASEARVPEANASGQAT